VQIVEAVRALADLLRRPCDAGRPSPFSPASSRHSCCRWRCKRSRWTEGRRSPLGQRHGLVEAWRPGGGGTGSLPGLGGQDGGRGRRGRRGRRQHGSSAADIGRRGSRSSADQVDASSADEKRSRPARHYGRRPRVSGGLAVDQLGQAGLGHHGKAGRTSVWTRARRMVVGAHLLRAGVPQFMPTYVYRQAACTISGRCGGDVGGQTRRCAWSDGAHWTKIGVMRFFRSREAPVGPFRRRP